MTKLKLSDSIQKDKEYATYLLLEERKNGVLFVGHGNSFDISTMLYLVMKKDENFAKAVLVTADLFINDHKTTEK